LKQGKFEKIDFAQNIYKLDHAFKAKTHIEPPSELKPLTPDWVMKDSGWSEDGPTAFKTIADFYNKETGDRVDGVITIDTTFMEDLMKIIGPIEMPSYGKTITAENFRQEVDAEVHTDYFTRIDSAIENEPKKIIGDMMPEVLSKTIGLANNGQGLGQVFQVLKKSLIEKHILAYSSNEKVQESIEKKNIGGAIRPSIGDFLYVNNSNMNGGKSSQSVRQNLDLTVDINEKGEINDKLTIGRDYSGKPDVNNINFVRLVIPQLSQITSFNPVSGNFEQFSNQGLRGDKYFWESNGWGVEKKIINFWMTTKIGEKSSAAISYKVNTIKLEDNFDYQLLVQRQPGALADSLDLIINYPEGYEPENVKVNPGSKSLLLRFTINEDKIIKLKFKRIKS
jgi:hypothetical protein